MGEEDGDLGFEGIGLNPAVEADFADGGVGVFEENLTELVEPAEFCVRNFPGVDAVGWGDEVGEFAAKMLEILPFAGLGGVDDAVGDASGLHFCDALLGGAEARVEEVIVGVDHGGKGRGWSS